MAVAAAVALVLSACGGHRAKFKPGDHVIRKLTGQRAIVAGRTRFLTDDIYWLKMPGGLTEDDYPQRLAGPGERTLQNWHLDYPYYEDDLVLSHD
jgi:hypothetical protein